MKAIIKIYILIERLCSLYLIAWGVLGLGRVFLNTKPEQWTLLVIWLALIGIYFGKIGLKISFPEEL